MKQIKNYLQRGLWNFSLREKKGFSWFSLKVLRVAVLSIRGFFSDGCSLHASSLTFYTLLSIVPLLALAFAISQGFGLQEYLKERILERFPENVDFLKELFLFSGRLLEESKRGVVAGAGALVLFWSATALLMNMEQTINWIWKVKKRRTWRRFFSDYFAIILIAPLVFLLSSSLSLYLAGRLKEVVVRLFGESSTGDAALFFIGLIPYLLLWFLYALLFYVLPNARVRFTSALTGGFVAGWLLLFAQAAYIYFQTNVTQYSAIYGSFAALPLFMIWIQINWFLLLLGVEISYACQTEEQNEFPLIASNLSDRLKRASAVWVAKVAIEKLKENQPITLEMLVKEKKVPYAVAEMALQMLVDAGILAQVVGKKPKYLPLCDIHMLRISELIEALERRGEDAFPSMVEIRRIEEILDSFWELIEKEGKNYYLKDLCNDSNR